MLSQELLKEALERPCLQELITRRFLQSIPRAKISALCLRRWTRLLMR